MKLVSFVLLLLFFVNRSAAFEVLLANDRGLNCHAVYDGGTVEFSVKSASVYYILLLNYKDIDKLSLYGNVPSVCDRTGTITGEVTPCAESSLVNGQFNALKYIFNDFITSLININNRR